MEDIKITSRGLSSADKSVLIGFPGSGLVGSIALQYLVDQMGFEQIGMMTSKYFPPVALMAKGVVNVPVRLYEKGNLAAIVADVPIHPVICYEVANGIMDWLSQFNLREVVMIAGIITNEPEKRVFGVATTSQVLQNIEDKTIILPMGSISGIAGSILTECKVRNIPAIGLLGETVNTPDPRASAAAIEVLNRMYNLNLDVQPLLDQALEIEAAMQQIAEQVQKAEAPPRKEQLPMYG
ncbi:MAG: proteasome assembly chaperone family protein [Methanomicrobiaceae archaeon]|uniref:Proteasome assembly chaperone family protein n=1 Tax=hydrocarbon metagenome TaxID=938273 RepID=A0A0W8FJ73_9ZZZZ|nr:proteasome assembly chaperone family protein [Methanomicrobiaceae archaeon]MDD5420242.1 proteasome assembly chaperone family protein [Methanomicrobiaceae archaeon]